MENEMAKRITITLQDSTLEKVDSYASELGVSRGGAISVMVDTVLQQRSAPQNVEKLMEVIQGMAQLDVDKAKRL